MKTLIAIPCMDTVSTEFTRSLLHMTQYENLCGEHGAIEINLHQGSLVYDSRNLLTVYALQHDFDRVLWIDSDMTFPANTAHILHAHLDDGHDAATGLYVKRSTPITPVLYKSILPPDTSNGHTTSRIADFLDYPSNTTFPVGGFGFGCVMTSTKLLQSVWNAYGPPFNPLPWAGEDISFCYRASLLHADMICDSSLQLGHIGMIQFTPDYYEHKRGDTH